jgi:tRNA(fMet)-specific endonuclease VapC
MYILDTNTLIYYFKGQGQVTQNLLNTPPQEIIISTIVVFELQVGIAKSTSPTKRIQQLQQLLSQVNQVDFVGGASQNENRDMALAAAKIRAQLEKQGTPIGPMDILIAGTAIALQATLVTHNVGEFSRIPGLSIADWY